MDFTIETNNIVFKEVELKDKNIIDKYLKQEKFMISDIAFGNLFIWRLARKIEFSIICDCLVIQTTYKDKQPFCFFPIGFGNKIECLRKLHLYYKNRQQYFEIHSIEKHNIKTLQNTFGMDIQIILNRDRSDYIYLTQNLIQLQGRKYHKKKNHLNRFFDEYAGFEFELINSSNTKELISIWKEWDSAGDNEGLINESKGIVSVFENYEHLDLIGGLLRFNGKIMAFSFGEVISQDICIIHIEKADINYRGAYQAINQQLLANCFDSILYVNREEDLGIEGLRKAKMSYNPDIILEKYEVIIK